LVGEVEGKRERAFNIGCVYALKRGARRECRWVGRGGRRAGVGSNWKDGGKCQGNGWECLE